MRRPLLRNPRTNLQDEPVPTLDALRVRRQTALAESAWEGYETDAPAKPTPKKQAPWGVGDERFLREARGAGMRFVDVADHLGRSVSATQKHAGEMGLTVQGAQGKYGRARREPWRAWTPEDEQYFLAARERGESYREIAEHLGRKEAAVRSHAYDRNRAAQKKRRAKG